MNTFSFYFEELFENHSSGANNLFLSRPPGTKIPIWMIHESLQENAGRSTRYDTGFIHVGHYFVRRVIHWCHRIDEISKYLWLLKAWGLLVQSQVVCSLKIDTTACLHAFSGLWFSFLKVVISIARRRETKLVRCHWIKSWWKIVDILIIWRSSSYSCMVTSDTPHLRHP